jgi:hypothetical protein
VGKRRKLFVFVAMLGAFVGASAASAHAGAQRAFCLSKGGTSAVGPTGLAECWVKGVNIFAPK